VRGVKIHGLAERLRCRRHLAQAKQRPPKRKMPVGVIGMLTQSAPTQANRVVVPPLASIRVCQGSILDGRGVVAKLGL